MTAEEARQLLKVAEEEDARVQEKIRKKDTGKKKPKKDW